MINTSPENLQLSVFDDDSGAINVKQSGIYEVTFVFFVPTDAGSPSVQIRLDNQPILSTIDQKQHIIYHADTERQVTFTCYLHIMENTKLSLCLSNNLAQEMTFSPKATARAQMSSRSVGQGARRSGSKGSKPLLPSGCAGCQSKTKLRAEQVARDLVTLGQSELTKGFLSIRKM